ncbi:MAG: cytochrome c [Cryomorphaceae bacterium]|nr:cytochrome c [Flavobacteriales bacterium]
MKNFKQTFRGSMVAVLVLTAASGCIRDEQSPGYEYTPDMYRSPAIEAYVDYGEVRDTIRYDKMHRTSARKPVEGTIAYSDNAMNDMPYLIPNTFEGYEKAGKTIRSPFESNEELVKEGKEIYSNFCIQCHGKEGQGNGPVVEKGGHPAPQPFNQGLKDLPEGKMFHTLTYGKGAMGSHASQLTKEERWTVVAYVMTLQHYGEDDGEGEAEESKDTE